MAIIYQNPNGKIAGRLGPIYARIVKGRNIFAIMPIQTGRLYDTLTQQYQKFKVAVQFCSALSLYPKLKALNESLRGRFFSGYHALVSKNFKLVGLAAPTEFNSIVVSGFGMVASDINLTETAVTAVIPALNAQTEVPADATQVRFLGSIVYSDPVDPLTDPPFQVTGVEKAIATYNFAAVYNLSQTLSPFQQKLGTTYQRKTVYIAAVLESTTGLVLSNSSSTAAVL